MARFGNFDDGTRFGLQPIGTSGINQSAPRDDTERRAMPGLATKGSVFSWTAPDNTFLYNRGGNNYQETVNLRNNTATGGSSVDVPTWAAGCLVSFESSCSVLGAGVTQQVLAIAPQINLNLVLRRRVFTATTPQLETEQLIIPFYDEPLFTITENSIGAVAGTVTCVIVLIGFVRNV